MQDSSEKTVPPEKTATADVAETPADEFYGQPILNAPYEYPGRHWELDENNQPTKPHRRHAATVRLRLAGSWPPGPVMALLIAWQTVNAVRRPGSSRFTRGFLVVTPGITIRQRLRVLQPNDPDSYYASRASGRLCWNA